MILILNKDNILSQHEIFELTRIFFRGEQIYFNEDINPSNVRIILNLIKKESSYKGVLTDSNNNSITEEIEFSKVNIYRDELSTRRIIAKQIIYRLFKMKSGLSLPWGVLTGIRPTKIVNRLLKMNINPDEVKYILINEYLLSSEKANLLIEIAKNQQETIENISEKTYSIYINIPFCPSRCSYCSFISLPSNRYLNEMDGYVNNLLKELELTRKKMICWEINSVYIGGGTPTSLNEVLMEKLIFGIKDMFPGIKEFSIEAGRPETLDIEYLKLFKKYNIDRISINPQTMNDISLKKINRMHTVKDIINCFYQARDIGIKSINMDIILGLPGENIIDLGRTLQKIKELKPDNLTVHVLAIKSKSDYKNNIIKNTQEDSRLINEMIHASRLAALDLKMDPYYLYRQKNSIGNFENVGYSSKDHICNYNISIIEEKETIIGIGMGAVSKIYDREFNKLYRIPNYKNLEDYTSKLDKQVSKKNNQIDKLKKGTTRYPLVPDHQ